MLDRQESLILTKWCLELAFPPGYSFSQSHAIAILGNHSILKSQPNEGAQCLFNYLQDRKIIHVISYSDHNPRYFIRSFTHVPLSFPSPVSVVRQRSGEYAILFLWRYIKAIHEYDGKATTWRVMEEEYPTFEYSLLSTDFTRLSPYSKGILRDILYKEEYQEFLVSYLSEMLFIFLKKGINNSC